MTTRTLAREIAWGLAIPVGLALLLAGNFLFATRCLLRLDTPTHPFSRIERHLAPIARPVAFATGRSNRDIPMGDSQQFLAAMGMTEAALPKTNEHLVPIDHIARANPYPQPLSVVYGTEPSYMSFGYIGTDGQYHQVTYYWGEADTTPSVLTPKVPGGFGEGDYFVRYTVYLSQRLQPRPSTVENATGQIMGWEQPPKYPDIDRIDWSTYRGPTYDGFVEIVFALGATCLEAVALGFLWRRRTAITLMPDLRWRLKS